MLISILLSGCFPLATSSMKWRIKWKPEIKKEKSAIIDKIKSNHHKTTTPNVILIVVDDLGKSEVSAYGSQRVATPNIDQIGKEGLTFNDAYASSPVCGPSRAGILTGRHQARYGYEMQTYDYYPSNIIEFISGKWADTENWVITAKPIFPREWQKEKQGLPPSEISLATMLKTKNYATAITGKWHLGHHRRLKPLARGFDYQYGFYGSSSLYTPDQKTEGYANHVQDIFSSKYQWSYGRYKHAAIRINDKEIKEEDYLTFAIKDEAIDFIEQHKEQPFFLYIPFNAPHVPFQAPIEYYNKFSHVTDENKRVYYAMISALDDAVGEIHQAVKNADLEEETIIVFVSDNGGASYTGATDNFPLKGGKLTQFEGGLNVPMMMKWKNEIDAGLEYDFAVSALDIFTTICQAAGVKLPNDRIYDGVDLLPYLNDENDLLDIPHDELYWRADHIWAMRKGDYKMIMSNRDGWLELYNLKEDKSEQFDLRKQQPEMVQQLINLHQAWQTELPERPLWPKLMDARFIIDSTVYMFPP